MDFQATVNIIESAIEKITGLSASKKQLEDEATQKDAQIADLTAQSEQKDQTIAQLQSEVESLQAAAQSGADKDAEIASLKNQLQAALDSANADETVIKQFTDKASQLSTLLG